MDFLSLEQAKNCNDRVRVVFQSEEWIIKHGIKNPLNNAQYFPTYKFDMSECYTNALAVVEEMSDLDFNDWSHSRFKTKELNWCIRGYVSYNTHPEYFI